MKILICVVMLLTTISATAQMSDMELDTKGSLSGLTHKNTSSEDETRKFAKAYIEHINRKNWIEGIEKFLAEDHEAFLKEHAAFRKSFPNYKATVKRIFVEGNEVVLWLNITANYRENYRYKNSNYSDQLLWNYEAKNQELDWEETWYFNVMDRKFGDKWDSIKDNYAILQGLNDKE